MSERLGIVGGSGFLGCPRLEGLADTPVQTDRGEVHLFVGEGCALLMRHGHGTYHPPHRIPHHAHVLAFESLEVTRVVGLNSVGSLKPELAPGTVVVPDDYLSLHPPPTFADSDRLHIVPTLDPDMRALLLAAARATPGPVVDGGVYVQFPGPRFETRAEIRLVKDHGDIVGMTAASEATLFQERGIAYANLGVVDNLAHGIGAEPLTFAAYERQVEANEERARRILSEVIRLFREGAGR
ncbi:MAG: MTAP family purine nucleoside phosphorylase [Planctomycetota bacterium]|jgi:5'-methylthioadenosine phosphorylase